VLRFRSGDELFNAAEFFQSQPLPQGTHVGIVSNSAGVATVAADACATRGLVVSQAASEAPNSLILAIRAGPEEYLAGVRALLEDPAVDAVTVHYVDLPGGDPEGILSAVSVAADAGGKPVVASIVRADGGVPANARDAVPNFRFPELCAGVLARAVERTEWLLRPLGQAPAFADLDPAAAQEMVAAGLQQTGGAWLTVDQCERLLATQGVPVAPSLGAQDVEGAVATARASAVRSR
jgi:acetate---CoA ligase (ADP-forming)